MLLAGAQRHRFYGVSRNNLLALLFITQYPGDCWQPNYLYPGQIVIWYNTLIVPTSLFEGKMHTLSSGIIRRMNEHRTARILCGKIVDDISTHTWVKHLAIAIPIGAKIVVKAQEVY